MKNEFEDYESPMCWNVLIPPINVLLNESVGEKEGQW